MSVPQRSDDDTSHTRVNPRVLYNAREFLRTSDVDTEARRHIEALLAEFDKAAFRIAILAAEAAEREE